MTLLDTHVWIWFVTNDPKLRPQWRAYLEESDKEGLALSIMSCWEVGKLVEKGKIKLGIPTEQWLEKAVGDIGATVLPLDYHIIADSTSLPGTFHRDPIDQIIVSTARVHGLTLMTEDRKILTYPHVNAFPTN